jgi:two-component sensor histidine kinase
MPYDEGDRTETGRCRRRGFAVDDPAVVWRWPAQSGKSMSIEAAPRHIVAGSLRDRPLLGYGLAIANVALALAVRLLLDGLFPPGFPFLSFFPGIIVTSFLAGSRPGALCALLSLLAAWYVLVEPVYSFSLGKGAVAPLLFFAMVATVNIAIIAAMQRALDRLRDERRLTARLYEQQRNLFAELQHRVANNMAFISGLLRLQKRRIAAAPETAAQAFDEAVTRIETMGRVHRQLYDPAVANQALQAHLQTVCEELLRAMGTTGVTCKVAVPQFEIALERLLPLSLLVAEVVTNSLKHGFADGRGGTITVTVETAPDGDRVLVIRDDGVGLPAGHDPKGNKGLGLRIIDGLVGQIGGRISIASDGGTVTRVHLPQ